MQTKVKSNSVITHKLGAVDTALAGCIIFTVKDAGEVVLDPTKLATVIRLRAETHGLIQRISDRAAIPRNTDTGKSATPEEKLEAMRELVDHYMSGSTEWNMGRAAGGARGPGADTRLLARALAELYPARTPEQLDKWIKARSVAERNALMVSEAIKAKIDGYRAEAATDVDAEELLGGLDDLDGDDDEAEDEEEAEASKA